MSTRYSGFLVLTWLSILLVITCVDTRSQCVFNVKDPEFGAVGDGKNLDSPAINKAIEAAAAANGVVLLPAGTYRSFSVRLKSNVTLHFEKGATLLAASLRDGDGNYDLPEPNPYDKYQDFGHSHWQNSLIWAENCENISIVGPGLIDGKGLVKTGLQSRTKEQNEALRTIMPPLPFGFPDPRDAVEPGWANKAIAIKNCRNVKIGDGLTISRGGHFAILATGVDGLTIDKTTVDTNRDGIDIDASSNVTITNSIINSPFDDGIVLKTTFALGIIKSTENITVQNVKFSGYDVGTLLDGTRQQTYSAYTYGSANGRFKIGTESVGEFKNIKVLNCEFTYTRGLALEIVDGGSLDGFLAEDIKMTDITNSPIFIRLGNRARGPEKPGVGQLKNYRFKNIIVKNADSRYSSIISGIPDYLIEGGSFENVAIEYQGGGTEEDAKLEPPEKEGEYPEPVVFGIIPASGFYVRHSKGVAFDGLNLTFLEKDARPLFVLDDVEDFNLKNSPPLQNKTFKERIKLLKF